MDKDLQTLYGQNNLDLWTERGSACRSRGMAVNLVPGAWRLRADMPQIAEAPIGDGLDKTGSIVC